MSETSSHELAELRAKAVAVRGEKYVRMIEANCQGGRKWREHMREIYQQAIERQSQ